MSHRASKLAPARCIRARKFFVFSFPFSSLAELHFLAEALAEHRRTSSHRRLRHALDIVPGPEVVLQMVANPCQSVAVRSRTFRAGGRRSNDVSNRWADSSRIPSLSATSGDPKPQEHRAGTCVKRCARVTEVRILTMNHLRCISTAYNFYSQSSPDFHPRLRDRG